MERHLGLAPSIAAISLIVAVFTFDVPAAVAQDAAAETLFSEGERLLAEGKTAAACDAFDASNRIETRAGTLINLGLCREKNGQLASAWSAFRDALSRVKDPKKKEIAAARVKALEPRLSYLTIAVPDEHRLEGLTVTRNGQPVDPALWNRAIPVDGGTLVIGGRAPGHEEWSATVEVPTELGKISIEVPRIKELAKADPKAPVVPASPIPPPRLVEVDAPGSVFSPRRKIALGVAGVGVGLLIGGIVLGTQANSFESDAFALCPDPGMPCGDGEQANQLIERGQSRALVANVAFGLAGGAALGAVVLWVLGAPDRSEARVAITPRAGTIAGLDLTVRF